MTEYPPIEAFRNPKLTKLTPNTVEPIPGTKYKRATGHLAGWDTSHVGMPGKNVRPPRSQHDYGYFHVGSATALDDTQPVDISVGTLTLDTGHASLTSDATDAAAHYDNTGTAVADVCVGEDEFGIWYSGVVREDVDDLKLHKFKASAVSGDWRPVNNSLELVAALMVNTPGFPIPRARVASAAELVPLVAAGIVPNPQEPEMDTHTPIAKGDYVELSLDPARGDLAIGQVVEAIDGGYVVEMPVGAAGVKPATEQDALAASAARTERQRLQSLESRIEQLTAALEARDRADEAARLLADVEV